MFLRTSLSVLTLPPPTMFVNSTFPVNLHTLSFLTNIIYELHAPCNFYLKPSITPSDYFQSQQILSLWNDLLFCRFLPLFPLSRHFYMIPSVQAAHRCWHRSTGVCYPLASHLNLSSCFLHVPFRELSTGSYRGARARKCPGGPSSWHFRLGVFGLELSSRWTHS